MNRTIRGLAAFTLWVAACGGATGSATAGGESHFLQDCSQGCGKLNCVADICTRSCLAEQSNCSDLSAQARCISLNGEPGSVAVCDVACSGDEDCVPLGGGFACQGGFCRNLSSQPPESQGGSGGVGPFLGAGAINDPVLGGSASPPEAGAGGGGATLPSGCATVGEGPIPEPSGEQCTANAASCSEQPADDCLSTPWALTWRPIARECLAYCGELAVGVSSGCVTAIQFNRLGTTSPSTEAEGKACLTQRLIGQNWDCQPRDGWVRFYIGSCTVP
jgi:hypothetical protein